MADPLAFWNKAARRYAARPMRAPESYEATLERVSAHLKPSDTVLEIGAGTATTALRLAPHVAHYIASDGAAEMVAIGHEKRAEAGLSNLTILRATPGDLPQDLPKPDVVLAFNLLHLLPNLSTDLKLIHALLPPGGLLISKTPCLSGRYRLLQPVVAGLKLFGKAPPVRFLSGRTLEHMLTQAGFAILETDDLPPPSRFIIAQRQ